MIYNLPQVKKAAGETWVLNEVWDTDSLPRLTNIWRDSGGFVSNGATWTTLICEE